MKTIRLIGLFFILAGCSSNAPLPLNDSASSAPVYDPTTATGRVFGSIKFEGNLRPRLRFHPGGIRFCVVAARRLREDDILVTKYGKASQRDCVRSQKRKRRR